MLCHRVHRLPMKNAVNAKIPNPCTRWGATLTLLSIGCPRYMHTNDRKRDRGYLQQGTMSSVLQQTNGWKSCARMQRGADGTAVGYKALSLYVAYCINWQCVFWSWFWQDGAQLCLDLLNGGPVGSGNILQQVAGQGCRRYLCKMGLGTWEGSRGAVSQLLFGWIKS